MNRHVLIVAILWAAFTVAGEALVISYSPFPVAGAEEADVVDEAFTLLTYLAVPIFAFVLAIILYSMLRFSRRGEPSEDGPPMRTHTPFIVAWFVITTALTIFVIINPGIIGINELRADREVDLLVQIEGSRFSWTIEYPEQNIMVRGARGELVLPIDNHVRFNLTATDVIHSFWVPAFRVKIDAVPGMVTSVTATPNRLGSFGSDVNYRLQCAEICGVGHSLMSMPVRVVEQDEFDAWVAEQRPITSRRLADDPQN